MISPTRFTTVITAVKAQIDTVCLFVFQNKFFAQSRVESRKVVKINCFFFLNNSFIFSRFPNFCAN